MRQTQPERTRLSWRRTVLAATVVGLLFARLALAGGQPSLTGAVFVALAVLAWLVLLVLAQRRIAQLAADRPPAVRRTPFVAGFTLFGYAVLGALVLMVHSG